MYLNERLHLTGILMAYCCSFSRWILFPWEKSKAQDLVEITPARPHHTTVQLHGYLSFPPIFGPFPTGYFLLNDSRKSDINFEKLQ